MWVAVCEAPSSLFFVRPPPPLFLVGAPPCVVPFPFFPWHLRGPRRICVSFVSQSLDFDFFDSSMFFFKQLSVNALKKSPFQLEASTNIGRSPFIVPRGRASRHTCKTLTLFISAHGFFFLSQFFPPFLPVVPANLRNRKTCFPGRLS